MKYRPSGGEVSEGIGRHACRPRVGRQVDRHVSRLSVDMSADISAESVDQQRSLLHMIHECYRTERTKKDDGH